MGWNWAKVSVVAIALAALGCSSDQDDADDVKLNCHLDTTPGVVVTVKGIAQYTTEVVGDAVVDGYSYSDGQNTVYVADPKQPFSVTVELEVGDLFQSSSNGYMPSTGASIYVHDTFTPADGSAESIKQGTIENEQLCWKGLQQ